MLITSKLGSAKANNLELNPGLLWVAGRKATSRQPQALAGTWSQSWGVVTDVGGRWWDKTAAPRHLYSFIQSTDIYGYSKVTLLPINDCWKNTERTLTLVPVSQKICLFNIHWHRNHQVIHKREASRVFFFFWSLHHQDLLSLKSLPALVQNLHMHHSIIFDI